MALQLQIYEAARRLCREEHLSKAVKRSRAQQCKREEKKIEVLQDTAFQLRLQHGRSLPRPGCVNTPRGEYCPDAIALENRVVMKPRKCRVFVEMRCAIMFIN